MEVFQVRHTIMSNIIPQLLLAAGAGAIANAAKDFYCGWDTLSDEDIKGCWITWNQQAHTVVGVMLALLLVFRTNLAYDRYYDGKGATGKIYSSIRNFNVAVTSFMRTPKPDEEGFSVETAAAIKQALSRDRLRLLRLSNLL